MQRPGTTAGRWMLMACVLGSPMACGPTPERYEVEVLGNREALERYEVRGQGLRDEGTFFARNRYYRRLSMEAKEGLHTWRALTLHSRDGGQEVDALTLEPFVCRQRPEKLAGLREEGWRLLERHQVLLTDEGRLKLNTDLDRVLSYTCEASRDGDGGEGWSTPLSTAGACSEPERAATQVVLESGDEKRMPDLCHATYVQYYGGAVHLGFSFVIPGSPLPLTVSLWHCMDPPSASYPVPLVMGEDFPRASCPRRPGVSTLVNGDITSAPMLRGTWKIDRIDFVDGGHLVGEVDTVFAVPGGDGEMRLRGHVDLPVLRIPSTGGMMP